MFELVTKSRLESSDFHKKIEFLIDGFIAKNLITLLYAAGGSGKSWLAYGIAKFAAGHGMDVIYMDYDNPLAVLAERQIEKKLINQFDNLYYVSSAKADQSATQMIEHILQNAHGQVMHNTLIVLDSLRDFCDVRNDNQAMQFMKILKALRELGATIIVLSHSNKDARNYEGSNNIYNSVDNMMQVYKIEQGADELSYLLESRKDRAGTGDNAWNLDTRTLTLYSMDVEQARLSTEDKDFIAAVKAALADGALNQKALLEKLGIDKRDKTANARLHRYIDKHWQAEKRRNVWTYQLLQQVNP